jgi:hypothetical protein
MEKKTLEEFIANLSPEEQERHQALIQECLERKELIHKYSEKAYKSIHHLSADLDKLKHGLMKLATYTKIQSELNSDLFSNVIPLLKIVHPDKPSMN